MLWESWQKRHAGLAILKFWKLLGCTYRKKRRVEHWDKVLLKFGNLLRYMKKWRDGNGIVQVFWNLWTWKKKVCGNAEVLKMCKMEKEEVGTSLLKFWNFLRCMKKMERWAWQLSKYETWKLFRMKEERGQIMKSLRGKRERNYVFLS